MAGEMTANRNYNDGIPGWYVVNPRTQIAVASCRSEAEALREAEKRNSIPPTPDPLEVVELVYSRTR